MKKNISLIIAMLLICNVESVLSQVRFRVAGGLSTDWIVNDNPAVYRLVVAADSERPLGGAFDGAQFGMGVKAYADLDKQKHFRIPFGIDYFSYSGAQSTLTNNFQVTVRHSTELWAGVLGFEWAFVEFPYAFARAYAGIEARATVVSPNQITNYSKTYTPESGWVSSQNTFQGKDGVTRLGGMLRLGVEGELYYPVFINSSIGYGVMNLFGRDMRSTGAEGGRGELLTPTRLNETSEGLLYHVNFTFMVQVRL